MSDTSATTAATTTSAPTTATTTVNTTSGVGILLLFIFIIVSIYCLVKSFLCFGKSGTVAEKIFGVVIAFFTGPFYLLYLNFNEEYCEDEVASVNNISPLPPQITTPAVGGRRRK